VWCDVMCDRLKRQEGQGCGWEWEWEWEWGGSADRGTHRKERGVGSVWSRSGSKTPSSCRGWLGGGPFGLVSCRERLLEKGLCARWKRMRRSDCDCPSGCYFCWCCYYRPVAAARASFPIPVCFRVAQLIRAQRKAQRTACRIAENGTTHGQGKGTGNGEKGKGKGGSFGSRPDRP
jgi:hypothetical protein